MFLLVYSPVPSKLTVCGLPTPVLVTLRVAALSPRAVGLKAILIVQLVFPASVEPQVLFVIT